MGFCTNEAVRVKISRQQLYPFLGSFAFAFHFFYIITLKLKDSFESVLIVLRELAPLFWHYIFLPLCFQHYQTQVKEKLTLI